jgi:hypothetical protein
MSGSSTLDPDNFPARPDRRLGAGHGTGALGPSDSSDSGSDLVGAPGLPLDVQDEGDVALDSATDSGGTGERAASGLETVHDGADIDVDHVESIPVLELDDEDLKFLESMPPHMRPRVGPP